MPTAEQCKTYATEYQHLGREANISTRRVHPERKFISMAKVPPFHFKKPNTKSVYHDNDKCTEGNNIEKQYLASGTAGRLRCEHCNRLA